MLRWLEMRWPFAASRWGWWLAETMESFDRREAARLAWFAAAVVAILGLWWVVPE